MTEYEQYVSFGGVSFELSNVTETQQQHTIKSKLGHMLIEKNVASNTTDTVLAVTGTLTGHDRTSSQTFADRISEARTALQALENGYKHSYDDGKHVADFVIVPGSLSFNDTADKEPGSLVTFSMTLKEW